MLGDLQRIVYLNAEVAEMCSSTFTLLC